MNQCELHAALQVMLHFTLKMNLTEFVTLWHSITEWDISVWIVLRDILHAKTHNKSRNNMSYSVREAVTWSAVGKQEVHLKFSVLRTYLYFMIVPYLLRKPEGVSPEVHFSGWVSFLNTRGSHTQSLQPKASPQLLFNDQLQTCSCLHKQLQSITVIWS